MERMISSDLCVKCGNKLTDASKGNNGDKKDGAKDEDKEDKKGLEENNDNKSPSKRIDID